MITDITTIQEIKEILSEIILGKTDKVTKISDGSVLNGLLYGIAKPVQKALKDIALIESHLFPEYAFDENLDIIAKRQGIESRYGSSGSSTFIRLVAEPNTSYSKTTNIFKSSNGISFELENDIVIGVFGYEYAKVKSVDVGLKTNVDPLTINRVTPEPAGHKYTINEYGAFGGRDLEQDELFKQRIQQSPNYLSSGTLAKLTQVFIKINNNVLRLLNAGTDNSGKIKILIATQNGVDLSDTELDDLLFKGDEYFSLSEQRIIGNQSTGILLENIGYYPIDIDFRVELYNNVNPDDVRKNIQIQIAKYLDFRNWNYENKVEWDNIFQIVKSTNGVKYVLDEYFIPRSDFKIDKDKMPRVRSFIMRSLEGNIIQNISGTLNPVFYQNNVDQDFQTITLSTF